MTDPRSDVVSAQYERWSYPPPIADLTAWLRSNWEWFDPSHAHRVLWPNRPYREEMNILVAGCGTNQAAVLAYTNAKARVVAVDVSQASLDHQQYLKDKHGLWNLELHRLPIEELPSLGREFDLVVSTGVLHHMADPTVGMRSIGEVLAPDGVAGIMLYAKYGRLGVDVMEGVFQDLELRQDDTSVRVVRETLAALSPDHPVQPYVRNASDLRSDAGLVDTFLHGRQRAYDVPGCLELVESAGLAFQGWLLKAPYYLHELTSRPGAFQEAVSALPEETMWSVMERMRTSNARHFFTACRTDRPTSDYVVDFSDMASLDYVPGFRWKCGLDGTDIYRSGWRMSLNPAQLPFVRAIDGQATIREIATAVRAAGSTSSAGQADLEKFGRTLFQALWRLDFVSMGLS